MVVALSRDVRFDRERTKDEGNYHRSPLNYLIFSTNSRVRRLHKYSRESSQYFKTKVFKKQA